MSIKRFMTYLGLTVFFASVGNCNCGSDSKPIVLDVGGESGAGFDAENTDIWVEEVDEADIKDVAPDKTEVVPDIPEIKPDEYVEPPEPAVWFCLQTSKGCVEEFDACLSLADDQYADSPGLQVDVVVTTENIALGQTAQLIVGGAVVDSQNIPAPQFSFNQVTLTHKPGGHQIEVKIPNVAFDQKVVCTDTGECGINVTPKNEGCVTQDSNADKAGFQLVFTVDNEATDCDEAWMVFGEDIIPPDHAALSEEGKAEIEVTLVAGDSEIVCQNVEISAFVGDSNTEDRFTQWGPFAYQLDNSLPVVTILEPEAEAVNLLQDEDEAVDGIQVTVSGTAEALAGDDLVELFLDDVLVEAASAGNGTFTFQATLEAEGNHMFEVRATDCCANQVSALKPIFAVFENSNIVIVAPAAGTVFLAKDNGDAGTATGFYTTITVKAPVCSAGDTLVIECKEDTLGSFYSDAGQLTIDELAEDYLYDVPVLLDSATIGNKILCRAGVLEDATAVSPEVSFTVGLPAPKLVLISPKENKLVEPADFAVSGTAENLDGREVSITLSGDGDASFSTTADEDDFQLEETAEALPDGQYTITIDATDQFGNVASEMEGSETQVTFYLDASEPEISFVAPIDGYVCTPPGCLDAIDDDIVPGHQLEVTVLVDGEPDPLQSEVCLIVNGIALDTCVVPADINGQFVATFFGVTLMPGSNLLAAWAYDALDHTSEQITAAVTLDADAPRVEFVSPAKDVVTATEPIQVIAAVKSPTDLTAIEDATVTLLVGNQEYDTVAGATAGTYQFEVTGLVPNVPSLLQLRATQADYANPGYSDIRKATLKDVAPGIAITYPVDDTTFNKASEDCTAGQPGCVLDVTATTENVENNQVATLEVTCTGLEAPLTYTKKVSGNAVSFTEVALPDNADCSLIASVEDSVGQLATSTAIDVTIDRTAPVLTGFAWPNTGLVPADYDEEDDEEFFQTHITVTAGGFEAGTTLTVQIVPAEGDPDELSIQMAETVPDGATVEVTFPAEGNYPFIPGANALTVTAADAAGNTSILTKTFSFFTTDIKVLMVATSYVENVVCSSSADCSQGVCADSDGTKRCVNGWGANKQTLDVLSIPKELFSSGTANLRVCSNHPAVTGDTCAYGEDGTFRVLKAVDHIGGSQVLEFKKAEVEALPQGLHRIFVEARRADKEEGAPDAWVTSMTSDQEKTRDRTVLVDSIPPVVTAVSFPGNVAPADQWLNKTEAIQDSTFEIDVGIAGAPLGSLALSVNNANSVSHALEDADPVSLEIQRKLFSGANNVCALAKDLVGNASAEVCELIGVDVFPPDLSFVYPNGQSVLLVGASTDVELLGEPLSEVSLTWNHDGAGGSTTSTANAQGSIVFENVLSSDGSWTLSATVSDQAGNQTAAFTEPATITLDTSPPAVTIESPVANDQFAQEDDIDPVAPGLQIAVSFETIDSAAWELETIRCPDVTYLNCEEPILKASGTNEGGATVNVTIGKLFNPLEYRLVRVTATDANGNVGSDEVQITALPGGCIVAFSNLPETGYLNNESFCEPAGQSCATASIAIELLIAGACGEADQVVLYADDTPLDSIPFAVGMFTFGQMVTVDDGSFVALEAKVMAQGAATGEGTGELTYTVDLSDPVPSFSFPDDDPFLCNAAVDENVGISGCQFTADVVVADDNLLGGELELLLVHEGDQTVIASSQLGASPAEHTFSGLSLPEVAGQTLALQASDAAGNIGETSIGVASDTTPPAALTLNEIDPITDVNRRRPSVRLTWNAVGDDGNEGGAAASYEVRYSRTPILNDEDFQAACDATEIDATGAVPAPGSPGSLESFDLEGPDYREPSDPCRFVALSSPGDQYYFAIRAVDEAGNVGQVLEKSTVSSDDVGLRFAKIDGADLGSGIVGRTVWAIGDINGDQMDELAVGGDFGWPGFCIVRGHTSVDTITLASQDDPNVKCYEDSYSAWTGLEATAVGDVNGDGFRDFGVTAWATEAGADISEYRIYLGNVAGFVDEVPAVSFVLNDEYFVKSTFRAAGNFNGDMNDIHALDDVVVVLPETNRVFVVPGNAVWKTSAPVTIDLLQAPDISAWSVLTVEGIGLGASAAFGSLSFGLGNVLPDNAGVGPQFDDLGIGQETDGTSVYVVKGRPFSAAATVSISRTLDGSGTEDSVVVRLLPDGAGVQATHFGFEQAGGADLDGDDHPDVLVLQQLFGAKEASSISIFSGAALAENLGATVQMNATQTAGVNTKKSDYGLRITGKHSLVTVLGNFDNAPTDAGASVDLAYGDFGWLEGFGHVYIRLSQVGNVDAVGPIPTVDLVLTDPFDPDNDDFGGLLLGGLSDFNGDGMPDLVVGGGTAGYAVLVY